MILATKSLSLMVLCCTAWSLALAQPPAASPAAPNSPSAPPAATAEKPKATAQSEAGEPRADTSDSPPAVPAAPPPAGSAAPAASAPSRAPAGRTATAAGAGQKSGTKVDRLDLGTATVTGDREQPKVMYIVPWKSSDIGDLAGKPMNSLVDEILAPVDRDVFKREVVYYQAVQADVSQNGAPPKPAQQGEK
jgi:hypothetical protein